MQLFTFWYNELDGDKNWLSKNVILAIMYGCMELGGTLSAGTLFLPPRSDSPAHDPFHVQIIKGCDPSKVSETGKLAVQLTIAVFTSTVHCQDFKDIEGDRITGRRTVPIMFPITSRLVVGLGLPIWSYLLCCIWDVDRFCTLVFVAYGCFVGGRFLCLRTRDADKRSCKYYSVNSRSVAVMAVFVGYTDFLPLTDMVLASSLVTRILELFP